MACHARSTFGWSSASLPPASAQSISPQAMALAASASATADEAQAIE